MRRTLIEHGRAERKIRVVYNGVVDLLPGIGNAPELRDELDLPPDALIGGMVSRLVPQKGHDLIVRVMAEHADLHNFFLVVVGPDRTRWGRQVRELAESLGLRTWVRSFKPVFVVIEPDQIHGRSFPVGPADDSEDDDQDDPDTTPKDN